MILTALLTTGTVQVVDGYDRSVRLIDDILGIEHVDWESTLNVGEEPYYQSKEFGPFPDHQFRISARASLGVAACNYTDNNDPVMGNAISWNPRPAGDAMLIFNGATGSVFPASASIPISLARESLLEWLNTRKRPTCIEWRPYDKF
ncbi:Imm1 family immunity protein [Amycolatopsis sp. M39]|nr:hypothetical protein A4R44_00826 [Amycolatopsis sp. M39]